MEKIKDEDMDKVVETLILAIKVINKDLNEVQAKNLLKNVGLYLITKETL